MLVLYFTECKQFGLSFKFISYNLNDSSFNKMDLRKTYFNQSFLQGVDFTKANLKEAIFVDFDLYKAIFEYTTIEKCDFRDSINFQIDLNINRHKKAKFRRRDLDSNQS